MLYLLLILGHLAKIQAANETLYGIYIFKKFLLDLKILILHVQPVL